MKHPPSGERHGYALEVGECDRGCHFGVDATFLEQGGGNFTLSCPACARPIDSAALFAEKI